MDLTEPEGLVERAEIIADEHCGAHFDDLPLSQHTRWHTAKAAALVALHQTANRIAELEAAVTRLTLALEMERGRGQPRAEVAGYAPPTRTYERFLEAIHEHSPNGELVVVRHHPNGDWSVLADLTAQVRAAYDSSIAATRTYQQGIEDAAKAANAFRCPLDRTADNTAYLIVDAIRALGTKERLLYRTALGTKP